MCQTCNNSGLIPRRNTYGQYKIYCDCPAGLARRRAVEGRAQAVPTTEPPAIRPMLPEPVQPPTEAEMQRFWVHIEQQMQGRVK